MQFLRNVFLSPNEARLRAGWRILVHLLLLALVSAPVNFLLQLITSLIPSLALFSGSFISRTLTITISIYIARRWLDKRSFVSLGLHWDAKAIRDLLVGILIAALLMAFIFLTEWAFGWLKFEGIAGQVGPSQTADIVFWALAFILVGFYEELLSRGYWLQNMAAGLGLPAGVFLSSAIFAFAHLSNPGASLLSTLGILAAGYFLAFGYLRTGQLWLPIGLHIGWNFFEGPIFGFPVSGLETARLLLHQSVGPEIITGGVFGPEAGLILLPALAFGAALIHRYTQSRHHVTAQDFK